MTITTDPRIPPRVQCLPDGGAPKINCLRDLILQAAREIGTITTLIETLKWGKLSYLVEGGSTVRIDWKARSPHDYQLYFKCTSRLVATFREVYGKLFTYEGNRALIFGLKDAVPEVEVRACVGMALAYHRLKGLPLLGLAG